MSKFVVFSSVVALVLGLGLGWYLHSAQVSKSPVFNKYGAVIGYLSAGGSQLTFNALNSLALDLTALRSPLAAVVSTSSAALQLPAAAGHSGSSTIVTVNGIVGANDFVIVNFASSSVSGSPLANGLYGCTAQANAANQAVLDCFNSASATQAAFGTDAKWLVFPQVTFVAPPALLSSTSTSSN